MPERRGGQWAEIADEEEKLKNMKEEFIRKQERFDSQRTPWEATLQEAIDGMREKFQNFMKEVRSKARARRDDS